MIINVFLLLIVSAAVYADDTSLQDKNSLDNSASINKKMQQCLSLVDMNELKRFSDEGLKLNKSVQLLCDNNKRNTAQNNAVGFALEIQKSKDISIYKQCGRITKHKSSAITLILQKYFLSGLRYKHICDYE